MVSQKYVRYVVEELWHTHGKQDKQRSVKLWYIGVTKMSDTLGRSCGTLNLPKAEEIQKRRFVAH